MKVKARGVCRVASVVAAAMNAAGLFFLSGGLLLVRPRFLAVYADMGVALPVATRVVLTVPGTVIVPVALLLLVVLVAKEFIPNPVVPLAVNLAWFLAGALLALLTAAALMGPMSALTAALQEG